MNDPVDYSLFEKRTQRMHLGPQDLHRSTVAFLRNFVIPLPSKDSSDGYRARAVRW